MPLDATCNSCNKQYSYPALQADKQTGLCPACQRKHEIKQLDAEIAALQPRLEAITPELIKLNKRRKALAIAHEKALSAWEKVAKVHSALDRKIALMMHERDILAEVKEVKTSKPGLTPAQKAKKALDSLPPEVRAAILKQFNQTEED
jgi:chromosome segregation ATPase